jgi:hypothetical protein
VLVANVAALSLRRWVKAKHTAVWAPLLSLAVPVPCPRHAPRAPLGYESLEAHSAGCSPVRNQPIYLASRLLTQAAVPPCS